MKRIPSVGRIVHYFPAQGDDPVGDPQAATITQVVHPFDPESPVHLFVMSPEDIYQVEHIPHASYPYQPGCWDWPEFVPDALEPEDAPA